MIPSDQTCNCISDLLLVTSNYPSSARPTHGTFVQQFAHAVARQGIRCTVIQPVALHRSVKRKAFPYHEVEHIEEGCSVEVFRPRYVSLSARDSFNWLRRFSPSRITLNRFTAAVRRTLRKNQLHPDALYGHFLYFSGATVVQIGREEGAPAFPCVGEGEFWTVRRFGTSHAQKALIAAAGFLANSSALKQALISELGFDANRISVFPNGTDLTQFRPGDKSAARKRFGLPEDLFLVASVGNFLEKKGIVRVGKAIDGLDGVAGVFAGSGPVPPIATNMALCRRVAHDEMPDVLAACDVFVLPTLVEGCCNAIVEAMACGLPIISSTGTFNDDLLDDSMSIRVDPMDVAAIRNAIVHLRDDVDLRRSMSKAALLKSKRFDVNDRARRMLEFMAAQGGLSEEEVQP